MSSPTSVEEVVASGLCTGCGLCSSLAGSDKIEMGLNIRGNMRPLVRQQPDAEVSRKILATCPGISVQGPGTPEDAQVHPTWGPIRQVHRSWSGFPEVRYKAAAGGTLTSLGRYLLASGEVGAILHVRASTERPWLTDAVVSTTEEEVTSGAQSRYGPSSPLVHIRKLLDEGLKFAVIAKPCDISAVRSLARIDERVDRQVRYLLTIFCGGVHNAQVPKAIIRHHGFDESEVSTFRYRGEGWPGPLRVESKSGARHDLPYPGGWQNKPWHYDLQFRCKICPDAVGEVADISVPDGWILKDGKPIHDEAPGRNIAVVRTERGERLVKAAVDAGFLKLDKMTVEELDPMHANHPARKLGTPVQLLALRVAGQRSLKAPGYRTWQTLRAAGFRTSWKQFTGTLRRLAYRDHKEPLI